MLGELDRESFQQFAPLLSGSELYACQRRFRFHGSDFADVDVEIARSDSLLDKGRALEEDVEASAKLLAAPVVADFSKRLNLAALEASQGQPSVEQQALLDELEQASRIVIRESARKIMVSACIGLSLFPPLEKPAEVEDVEDCFYEDVSFPLPVIAQRLYNDNERRSRREMLPCLRRAQTASYILDFAEEVGVKTPEMPESYRAMLAEFQTRISEWEAKENQVLDGEQADGSDSTERTTSPPGFWKNAFRAAETLTSAAVQETLVAPFRLPGHVQKAILAAESAAASAVQGAKVVAKSMHVDEAIAADTVNGDSSYSAKQLDSSNTSEQIDYPWYDVAWHY